MGKVINLLEYKFNKQVNVKTEAYDGKERKSKSFFDEIIAANEEGKRRREEERRKDNKSVKSSHRLTPKGPRK